jgi:hypothetical protein
MAVEVWDWEAYGRARRGLIMTTTRLPPNAGLQPPRVSIMKQSPASIASKLGVGDRTMPLPKGLHR